MVVRGATFALLALLPLLAAPLARAEVRKSVLILYDEDKDLPGLATIHRSLREGFTAALNDDIELFSESMNLSQFREASHERALVDHYRRKYAGKKLDLIIAVMGPSLDFLLRHGDALFPSTPIVFCGPDASDIEGKTLRPNITGVVVKRRFAPTLDIALRLQPGTRNVFVVGGASAFDRRLQAIARPQFRAFESRVLVTYLTALPMGDLLKTLARLPPHSVVLYLTVFADGAGRAYVPHEALSLITEAANAPVYVFLDQYLGRGVVGGHLYSLDRHGHDAAEIGLRILRGEAPASIPVREIAAHVDTFDGRQLQRWKLDERRLPPGSIVRFRSPPAWGQYRWYIVGGATLFLTETALIVGLLVNRAQRRRAQRTLAERLRFETLLSELSTTFLTRPASEIDQQIERMLRRIVEELDFDRAALAERAEGTSTMRVTYSWTRGGVAPVPTTLVEEGAFPWMSSLLVEGHMVRIPRLEALPEEAAIDRRSLAERGIRSMAAIPLIVGGAVVGALGFARLHEERTWPDELVPRLYLLAGVFANVLARRRADSAVRESEEHRRRAEEETRQQREELAHALRVATLGELTASFAHELNQPLTAIMTNAQATYRLLDSARATSKDITEALVDIAEAAKRASQIIRRLRTLFRKEHAERAAVDVNALIEDVVSLLRTDLQGRRIVVRFALGEALPSVLGDPVQLRQVILNLVVNACEAITVAEDGRREILIETSQPQPGRVAIAIRDSGIGVKESELERIFEHFVSSKPQGLGMGLAISRSIVQAHGGDIRATRNDDRGLTLHVELPVGADGDPRARP